MMKMDGRDSAECQNWEKRNKIGIFEIVKLENDKNENSSHLLQTSKREKHVGTGESRHKWKNGVLERESLTSL